MNKIIPFLMIFFSLTFAVCGNAEEQTLPKIFEPGNQYAPFVKADLTQEIKKRWETVSLNADTYQYELAQLAVKVRKNVSTDKNDRNTALYKKIESLSALLNDIGREVEDSLNNLTLDETLLLFGKTSTLLKGVDEVRYSVILDELFRSDK